MIGNSKTHIFYGVLDLVLAALYAFLFLYLIPSRSTLFTGIALSISFALALGGIGMLIRTTWGAKIAALACILMLIVCAVLILLLVSSAAYLHGIFGGIGQAGVVLALILAGLSIEIVGLVPALQLAYLRRQIREWGKCVP
ncbi:MAG: hypothetical protein V1754_02120 [Pseudomonadota bacterium]